MPGTTWTTLGTIGGTGSARVDGAGRIVAADDAWSLSWTIGAEDRWHDPAETANVRQAELGAAPVVETRMRVPGGDIIHRAFALHVAGAEGGSEWVVVEIENDSAVPVALALTRTPGTPLVTPREPNDVRDDGSLAFSLTHRATLRFLVGISGDIEPAPKPDDLPPLDAVQRGWTAQLDRGARIVVPDTRLQEALDVTRAYLLVDASRSVSPTLAAVLDEYGLHGEARSIVARLVEFRFDHRRGSFGDLASNASVVNAVARHQALAPDPEFAAVVVEPMTAGIQRLVDAVKPRRFGRTPSHPAADVVEALRAAPAFLRDAGEPAAATTLQGNLETVVANPPQKSSQDSLVVVDDLLSTASPTWTWATPDGTDRSSAASVRFAHHLRRMLLDERDDGLILLPAVPKRWIGQPVEVHELPTRFGLVSFAIRWHGERPALLWELDAVDDDSVVPMTCGLDESWSSADHAGETLLAAPA